jgi:hypothetical protein
VVQRWGLMEADASTQMTNSVAANPYVRFDVPAYRQFATAIAADPMFEPRPHISH